MAYSYHLAKAMIEDFTKSSLLQIQEQMKHHSDNLLKAMRTDILHEKVSISDPEFRKALDTYNAMRVIEKQIEIFYQNK